MDHLRAMQVFSAIAREGSLVGASRKLSISPASVTRVIQELEEHLGTPLLIRTTRAIKLTDTGISYLESIERILDDIRTADHAARGEARNPHGVLRLTAPRLFGRYYIAPIISEYVKLYPEVHVEAVFLDNNSSIIDDGFDIALRIGELKESSMRATKVGAVRLAVSGAPSYFERMVMPTHPEELSEHEIIGYEGPAFSPTIWSFDDGLDAPIKPRVKFNDMAACIRMASLGYGLTQSLSYQIGHKVREGTLKTVLDDFTTEERPINLIRANQYGKSAKLRAFLELATSKLRADPILNP